LKDPEERQLWGQRIPRMLRQPGRTKTAILPLRDQSGPVSPTTSTTDSHEFSFEVKCSIKGKCMVYYFIYFYNL
jgi:hypothetical protein